MIGSATVRVRYEEQSTKGEIRRMKLEVGRMRIPTIPPSCSEGRRPSIPIDSAHPFRRKTPPLFSGRIGA